MTEAARMSDVLLDSGVGPTLQGAPHEAQAISGANGDIKTLAEAAIAEGKDRLTGEPIRKSLGRKRLNAACRSITPPLT